MRHESKSAIALTVAAAAASLALGAVWAQSRGTYHVYLTMPVESGVQWEIDPIWHLPWYSRIEPEPDLEDADGRLIFRSDAGSVLHSRLVERGWYCNGDCRETDHSFAVVPAQPDARWAELHEIDAGGNASELMVVRERSPAAPEVEIVSPRPGETLRDGTVIEWRADDADGDRLEYRVLYRPSVGYWSQLALDVGTSNTRYTFTRGRLPADENATIAIQANDGFNTVEATVSGLKVIGNLPPEVYVYAPRDGDRFGYRSNIILSAYADDPEDGDIPVVWESSLDGVIRPPNWASGSRGTHILTVTATDSGGIATVKFMAIYIGVDPPTERVFLPSAVKSVIATF